ncbi:MAG: hypothetical protein MZU91_15040 [Desulfosudis oleivorans]|nr:hypothetical protein [Desulfosudis oleivorans]
MDLMARIIEQGWNDPPSHPDILGLQHRQGQADQGNLPDQHLPDGPSSVADILGKILDEVVDSMGFDRGIILLAR